MLHKIDSEASICYDMISSWDFSESTYYMPRLINTQTLTGQNAVILLTHFEVAVKKMARVWNGRV